MTSEVDICNLALFHIGQKPIASIDEGTASAEKCKLLYDFERNNLMSKYNWNFSLKKAQLARLVTPPLDNYQYSYQIPSDSKGVIKMSEEKDYAYKIYGNTLETNHPQPIILYKSTVEDPNSYPPYFTAALTYRLAASLGMAFNKPQAEINTIIRAANEEFKMAKLADTRDSGTYDQYQTNQLVEARHYFNAYEEVY